MKILLVEDDDAVQETLQELLFDAFENLEMTSCMHGSDALLNCMKSRFDLIVTDFKMPVMTGLDFVSILRHCDCSNQKTPVIFLSGYVPLLKDMTTSFENVHFMDKPVQVKRFLNLASILTQRPQKKAG